MLKLPSEVLKEIQYTLVRKKERREGEKEGRKEERKGIGKQNETKKTKKIKKKPN